MEKTMLQWALKIICIAGAGYIGYCGLLFFLQRQMLFPRHVIEAAGAPEIPHPEKEVFWLEGNGFNIECWYLPPSKTEGSAPSPVVIFAHGNAELIDFWPEELLAFSRLGMGILLVEYPGYGRSTGRPSQKSITDAFVQAYDRVAARSDVDAEKIVLFGRSLGGGAVCALSLVRPSAGMILMSCFTSVRQMAGRYLVPEFLVRDPFDNLAAVTKYRAPLLIIHGKADEVIGYTHGVALAGASKTAVFKSYDCGHNDFPAGWYDFDKTAEAFLRQAGILEETGRKPSENPNPAPLG